VSGSHSGLAEPPGELDGFPRAGEVSELHRLSEHPGAWWYSHVRDPDEGTGGRFDLTEPHGTCYLATSLDGALVEKLLRTRTKVVVAERLHELFHATIEVRRTPPTADLASPGATGYGCNAEIHATLDYALTRRWARALRAAGWRALRHLLRGDAAGGAVGLALFGRAGLHSRAPAGMTTTVRALDRDEAERLLAARNVVVRPIPDRVPIARPDPPT
jgi:hypothetical protein